MKVLAVGFIILLFFNAGCITDPPEELDEHQQSSIVTYGVGYTGYLVQPVQEGEFPGIVLIHDWWGLNDIIKQEAHNLAREGYVVLAVDLYDGKIAATRDDANRYSGRVGNDIEGALANMRSAKSFLRSHESVSDSIGSMGWCFGGEMSLQLAFHEELNATVIYYSPLETDPEKLGLINGPVLGFFGAEDEAIPVLSVKEFEKALNELKIENEIYIYDGVGHEFVNPSNPGHDPEKTKDAWDKTVLFLNRNLKG